MAAIMRMPVFPTSGVYGIETSGVFSSCTKTGEQYLYIFLEICAA